MNFQISPLAPARFENLFGKSDEELAEAGAKAYIADAKPGFPCRVALRDAEPGERLILLNYEHQPASSPYRSSHAIFVLDGAVEASPKPNEVPEILHRQLSVRAFDLDDMIVEAEVIDGENASICFERMLSRQEISYLHVHTAGRGCFLARVERCE